MKRDTGVERKILQQILKKHGVILASIGSGQSQ